MATYIENFSSVGEADGGLMFSGGTADPALDLDWFAVSPPTLTTDIPTFDFSPTLGRGVGTSSPGTQPAVFLPTTTAAPAYFPMEVVARVYNTGQGDPGINGRFGLKVNCQNSGGAYTTGYVAYISLEVNQANIRRNNTSIAFVASLDALGIDRATAGVINDWVFQRTATGVILKCYTDMTTEVPIFNVVDNIHQDLYASYSFFEATNNLAATSYYTLSVGYTDDTIDVTQALLPSMATEEERRGSTVLNPVFDPVFNPVY